MIWDLVIVTGGVRPGLNVYIARGAARFSLIFKSLEPGTKINGGARSL